MKWAASDCAFNGEWKKKILNKSLWLKSGDLRWGKGVLMADM